MAKVEFTRVQTNAEVENINIKDGQFIVTGEGKTFVDYGEDRIGICGTPDIQMSDSSTNSVENRVIKEYIDNKITNEYSTSIGLGYSANYVNNMNTYSTTEEVDTGKVWIDGKKIYRKVFTGTTPNSATGAVNFNNNIDTLVSEDIYFLSGSNYFVTKGYYEGSTPQFSYVINKSTNVYFSVLSTTARNMSFYLIMEYTKP